MHLILLLFPFLSGFPRESIRDRHSKLTIEDCNVVATIRTQCVSLRETRKTSHSDKVFSFQWSLFVGALTGEPLLDTTIKSS